MQLKLKKQEAKTRSSLLTLTNLHQYGHTHISFSLSFSFFINILSMDPSYMDGRGKDAQGMAKKKVEDVDEDRLERPFVVDAASWRLPAPSSRKAFTCIGLMLTEGGDVLANELERIGFGLLCDAGLSCPEEMDIASTELFVDFALPFVDIPTGLLRSDGVL